MRTLALAYVDYPVAEFNEVMAANNNFEDSEDLRLENNHTLVGIFGIKDGLRDSSKSAISILNNAGINVRMLTGDNIVTATQIGIEAGLLTEQEANGENQKQFRSEGYEFMGEL